MAESTTCRWLAGAGFLACVMVVGCSDEATLSKSLAEGKEHLSRRHYPPALASFDAVLAIDPSHFEARRLKAEILYNTARLDEAAEMLVALNKESPSDGDVLWGLGMVRKDQLQFAEALVIFESMSRGDRPMYPLAETLTGVGRHDEAANWVGRYLARYPFDSKAYYLLSKIEFRRGRERSGKFWADYHRSRDKQRREDGEARGMEYRGQALDAMMYRAQKMCERGRYFEGLQDLTRVVQQNPSVPMAFYMIGRIMADIGDPANAIKAFDRVLALVPGEPNATRMRAEAQARIQTGGGEKTTPVDAAKRHFALGRQKEARQAVLFAAQSNPKDLAALRLLGQIFDRPDEAFLRLWAWQLALTLAPDDAALKASLQTELTNLGMKF